MSTILIIDDDARFREQARELLETDGFEVVGHAVDGASGIEAARTLRPEFVLVDIGLPDIDGFAVARELSGANPAPVVILTSSRDARAYGPRVATPDAIGFVPKELVSGATIRGLAGR